MSKSQPDQSEKIKIFFPNLDGLRFFSFMGVFFAHIFFTENEGVKNSAWYLFFKGRLFPDGDLGVGFFFVLSGFLITYLLLKEQELTGKIRIGNFYIRRTLRIWPLYYFCVFFGFVIFPVLKSYFGQVPNETASPVLCSTFLNNFDRMLHGSPDSHVLSVLWSVGIEEQFYVLWPILFAFVPARYYYLNFIVIISMSLTYRFLYPHAQIDLNTIGVISDMAIGGCGAYLASRIPRFMGVFQKIPQYFHIIPYAVVILLVFYRYQIFASPALVIFKRVIESFFFIWIIMDQNFSLRNSYKVSNLKWISWLGKYTYGLYCLHTIAGLVMIVVLSKLHLNNYSWQLWFIQMPLTLGLSIFFAWFSFTYFESWFMKLKSKFAFIVKE